MHRADLADVSQEITTNLQKILTQLTTKGGYKGQIVLVNYYSINSIDPSGTNDIKALNQIEQGAVAKFKTVRVANAFSLWANASKNTPDGVATTPAARVSRPTWSTRSAGYPWCERDLRHPPEPGRPGADRHRGRPGRAQVLIHR